MAEELVVAGRGNVGRSLVRAFNAAGHAARLVPSREPMPRVEAIFFLAVPDHAVPHVAREMASAHPMPAAAFVHLSGGLGLDVLAPLSDHEVGSFHPLRAFPFPQPPEAFASITVAVDASATGLERRLAQLARDLGASPRHVGDADRALYHAAAVLASNYAVALMGEAVELLRASGWPADEAEHALLPLIEGAVANIRAVGLTKALTGPVRRGDSETVERHLAALSSLPRASDLYRMLGLVALEIAIEAGLDPAAARRTRRALTRDVAATQRRGRR